VLRSYGVCCADAARVNVDAFFASRRLQFVDLAARYRTPATYNSGECVKAGDLMSHGDNRLDSNRQVGVYARLLKGEKAAGLPLRSRPNSSCSSISRPRPHDP